MTSQGVKLPQVIEALEEISAWPLARWPERFPDARLFGYLNTHVPGEVLHAGGFAPVRVFGRRCALELAETRLPGFTYWLVRSALDAAMAGELDFLGGMAFALVAFDTQPGAGNNALPPGMAVVIILDHHPWHEATAAAQYADVRQEVGATSTILTEYLQAAGIEPDPLLATALFYGIKTDTMGLGRGASSADAVAYFYLQPRVESRRWSRSSGRKFQSSTLCNWLRLCRQRAFLMASSSPTSAQ